MPGRRQCPKEDAQRRKQRSMATTILRNGTGTEPEEYEEGDVEDDDDGEPAGGDENGNGKDNDESAGDDDDGEEEIVWTRVDHLYHTTIVAV